MIPVSLSAPIHPPCQSVFNFAALRGEPLSRTSDELLTATDMVFQRCECLGAKGWQGFAVLQHANYDFVAVKVNKLLGAKILSELFLQNIGVCVADAEANQRPHITEDGPPDRLGKLLNELVAEGKTKPELARLGQHRGEGVCRKVLELVNAEVEVTTFVLRLCDARHRRELELGSKQGAEKIRFVVADASFREIGNKYPAVVHDKRDTHLVSHLAENVSDNGIEKELSELVLNWNYGFATEARFVAGEFRFPKRTDERVFDLPHHPCPILVVRQQPVDAKQGSVRAVEQGRDGIVEDVFEAWPPRISPDALERSDDAGRNKVPVVRRDVRQQV